MTKKINLVLFDSASRENLLPLTFTRPVAELRIGIDTIREKWEHALGVSASWHTVDYLAGKFPVKLESDNLFVNGSLIPDNRLIETILKLSSGTGLIYNETVLAYRSDKPVENAITDQFSEMVVFDGSPVLIQQPWELFSFNDQMLILFAILREGNPPH
jgi:hypothetical protein